MSKKRKLKYNDPGETVVGLPLPEKASFTIVRASRQQEPNLPGPVQEEMKTKSGSGVPMPHPLYLFKILQDENPWVDLAVRRISLNAAKCTPIFRITSEQKGRKKIIKGIEKILKKPAKGQTGYNLFLETYEDLVLYGNSYWQLIRDHQGNLHSIYRLPAEAIRVEPFVDGDGVVSFKYIQIYPYRKEYKYEEVIHFKNTNKKSFLYGKPVFYSNLTNITIDENVSKWVANFFEEGFAGGVIFRQEADEETAERNREWLQTQYTGARAAGTAMLIEGDVDLLSEGNKLKELDYGQLKRIPAEDILSHAGVPISQAGIRSDNGNANAEVLGQEERVFLDTIEHYQNIVFETLKTKFIDELLGMEDIEIKAGLNLSFNVSNRIKQAEAASKFGARLGDIHQLLGLPIIENDDARNLWVVASNNGTVRADAVYMMDPNTGEFVDQKILDALNGGGPQAKVKPPSNNTNPDGR